MVATSARTVLKTAQEWADQAKDRDVMVRYFLVERCNGSADRFDRFMKSKEYVQIPGEDLVRLGEA